MCAENPLPPIDHVPPLSDSELVQLEILFFGNGDPLRGDFRRSVDPGGDEMARLMATLAQARPDWRDPGRWQSPYRPWSRLPPNADGLYLRSNGGKVTTHRVVDGKIDWEWKGGLTEIGVGSPELLKWRWLGPLPFPPLSEA